MIRRALAGLAALLALTACPSADVRALEAERARLTAERDKLAQIAEHLDEYRTEVARLADALERVKAMGGDLTHEERLEALAKLPGVTRTHTTGQTYQRTWTYEGPDLATLERARRTAAPIAAESLAVTTSGRWILVAPEYDASAAPAAQPGVRIAPPLPAPGRFQSGTARRLRAEVEALQKECAELQRLVGEVSVFERRKRQLEAQLTILSSPGRLNSFSHLLTDLRAACSAASVATNPGSGEVRFRCKPMASTERAEAALRARYTEQDPDWRLGPLSIDDSAPEPLQGTFRPR